MFYVANIINVLNQTWVYVYVTGPEKSGLIYAKYPCSY